MLHCLLICIYTISIPQKLMIVVSFSGSLLLQEANCFANLTARDGEEPRRKRHHPSLHPPDEKRDMPISGHLVKRTGFKKAQAVSFFFLQL